MSQYNVSYSILLGANEESETTSIIVTTTEKVNISSVLIILISGLIVICAIVLIALICIFCYWDIFTPEKTPAVKAKVPVEKVPRKKGDKNNNNKSRYLVHKKGSYDKTIYFANFSGQTKDSSSMQNSRKSPKLNNPKFNQQKSASKLRQVPQNASLPVGSKTRTWRNRSSKTKMPAGKRTSESATKNVGKKRSLAKVISKKKSFSIVKR